MNGLNLMAVERALPSAPWSLDIYLFGDSANSEGIPSGETELRRGEIFVVIGTQ
jgi:hypothetical protein